MRGDLLKRLCDLLICGDLWLWKPWNKCLHGIPPNPVKVLVFIFPKPGVASFSILSIYLCPLPCTILDSERFCCIFSRLQSPTWLFVQGSVWCILHIALLWSFPVVFISYWDGESKKTHSSQSVSKSEVHAVNNNLPLFLQFTAMSVSLVALGIFLTASECEADVFLKLFTITPTSGSWLLADSEEPVVFHMKSVCFSEAQSFIW